MILFTTPTIKLTVPDTLDLTEAASVYVTISQPPVSLTISGAELTVTAHRIEATLTQEQSGLFQRGGAEVQVNLVYADGKRAATLVSGITIEKNLMPAILPGEGS